MLRFTTLINFSLAGAILAPAALQKGSTEQELVDSLQATEHALRSLDSIQEKLRMGDYSGVDDILSATETPFGSARERSQLMDQLRREIGELEFRLQEAGAPVVLEHLGEDPTQAMRDDPEGHASKAMVATTGLSTDELVEVGNIWPPIADAESNVPQITAGLGDRYRFEKSGFTVDAVRQGRAYYRATRYKEALRLFETKTGEPDGDYWIGRALERLNRPQEAVAAYTRVIENEKSGAISERAASDRDFVMWLINFDRKVEAYNKSNQRAK